MAKRRSLSLVFIFFVAFLCMVKVVSGSGCFWSSGWFINVANLIGKEKVLVHCRSKENDIGEKTIGWNESVHWQFCENIVSPSSLYYCHFYLGNREQTFDVFNGVMKHDCVEKEKKDFWRCTWLLKSDGFYFVDRTSGTPIQVKKYDWKPMGSR